MRKLQMEMWIYGTKNVKSSYQSQEETVQCKQLHYYIRGITPLPSYTNYYFSY